MHLQRTAAAMPRKLLKSVPTKTEKEKACVTADVPSLTGKRGGTLKKQAQAQLACARQTHSRR